MSEPAAVAFTGLVDLAAAVLGGRALGASDDFFAAAETLIQPGRGVFIEGRYTDRGKWMDGWESRRRRAPRPGPDGDSDWCVLELGAPGEVLGFDVDTNHFLGNHPPFASIDGVSATSGAPVDELLARGDWVELLEQSPLRPGSQNLFAAIARAPVSHVRLRFSPTAASRGCGSSAASHRAGSPPPIPTRRRSSPPTRSIWRRCATPGWRSLVRTRSSGR